MRYIGPASGLVPLKLEWDYQPDAQVCSLGWCNHSKWVNLALCILMDHSEKHIGFENGKEVAVGLAEE
jgi:hypothetical protein